MPFVWWLAVFVVLCVIQNLSLVFSTVSVSVNDCREGLDTQISCWVLSRTQNYSFHYWTVWSRDCNLGIPYPRISGYWPFLPILNPGIENSILGLQTLVWSVRLIAVSVDLYCCCRYLFNDAEVKPFDPAQIANECFGGEMTVILFYHSSENIFPIFPFFW